jgi:hypothetical protein
LAKGVFRVTRPRSNVRYSLVQQRPLKDSIPSLSIIEFDIERPREAYPKRLCLVEVEVDKEIRQMPFSPII